MNEDKIKDNYKKLENFQCGVITCQQLGAEEQCPADQHKCGHRKEDDCCYAGTEMLQRSDGVLHDGKTKTDCALSVGTVGCSTASCGVGLRSMHGFWWKCTRVGVLSN